MNPGLRLVAILLVLAVATWVAERRDRPDRPRPLLGGFWSHLRASFSGWNAFGLGLSVVVTVLLVVTGWDRSLQDLAQRENPLDRPLSRAVLEYGEWWTAAVAGALILAAWVRRTAPWRLAGSVALQAVLAGLVVTLSLKLLTGRLGPASPDAINRAPFPKVWDAGDFAFDFWRRTAGDGRFFWPSGHTLSSMVLVAALAAAFPLRRWIPWVGFPLVAFVGVAMIDGDFHWTTDVLAAVLLGYPIGRTVGSRLAAEHARRGPPKETSPEPGDRNSLRSDASAG